MRAVVYFCLLFRHKNGAVKWVGVIKATTASTGLAVVKVDMFRHDKECG